MNLNIVIEKGVKPFGSYRIILTNRVIEIAKKLNIQIEHIEWVIFDPESRNRSPINSLIPLYIPRSGCDFGYCYRGTNKVWISTLSIQSSNPFLFKLPGLRTLDTLTEVVVDELVHIITQSDHGTKEYDELHSKYTRKLIA